MANNEDLIFVLDIGTRTIIGLVMKYRDPEYKIIASEVIEHERRAMLDGQIHNVNEVARQVNKVKNRLEEKLDTTLKRVGIAAAGRALKTVDSKYSTEFSTNKIITEEDVQSLEFAAVQKAQEELAVTGKGQTPADYHFVGYSTIEYKLDDIFLASLIGQRGKNIQVKLVVTFLPRIVIDSLLSVINQVDLEVEHLTLEPIAASRIVIPEEMQNFNLALVDIGAGTSDIALTKGGSMIGYAMVPVAGDEITEALSEHYLLDYKRAETVKRCLEDRDEIDTRTIMGKDMTINCEEAREVISTQVNELSSLIAKEILAINKKSPQAVLCIGGGSLTPLLTSQLAEQLGLSRERVGIKDSSDLNNIEGSISDINSTQALTPIGIAISSRENKNRAVFVNLEVNDNPLQMFTVNEPTVSEALLAAEVDIKNIQGKPGKGITCTVNGELKTVKGTLGEAGDILVNGEQAELDTPVFSGDSIQFTPGKDGQDATATIGDIVPPEVHESRDIKINGNPVTLKPKIYQNGSLVRPEDELIDGAEIEFNPLETIEDGIVQVLEISPDLLSGDFIQFTINGERKKSTQSEYIVKEGGKPVRLSAPLEDGLELKVKENDGPATIGEFLENKETIRITFNGSELELPARDWVCRANGEKVARDYEIKDGDKIECKPRPLTVNRVLNFIDYNLTEDFKEDVKLFINGEAGEFKQKLNNGDVIKIQF